MDTLSSHIRAESLNKNFILLDKDIFYKKQMSYFVVQLFVFKVFMKA